MSAGERPVWLPAPAGWFWIEVGLFDDPDEGPGVVDQGARCFPVAYFEQRADGALWLGAPVICEDQSSLLALNEEMLALASLFGDPPHRDATSIRQCRLLGPGGGDPLEVMAALVASLRIELARAPFPGGTR